MKIDGMNGWGFKILSLIGINLNLNLKRIWKKRRSIIIKREDFLSLEGSDKGGCIGLHERIEAMKKVMMESN